MKIEVKDNRGRPVPNGHIAHDLAGELWDDGDLGVDEVEITASTWSTTAWGYLRENHMWTVRVTLCTDGDYLISASTPDHPTAPDRASSRLSGLRVPPDSEAAKVALKLLRVCLRANAEVASLGSIA